MKKLSLYAGIMLVLITTQIYSYMQYCPFGTSVCPDPRLGGRTGRASSIVSCMWKDELPTKESQYAYTLKTSGQQVEYVTGQSIPDETCYVVITADDIAQVKRFIGDFDRYETIQNLLSARMKQAGGSNVGILPGENTEFRYMPAVLILQDLMQILPGTISTHRTDSETNKTQEIKQVSILQALDEIKKIELRINS